MKRAALMVLLAACTASSNDYPMHAGGDGVVIGTSPGTGTTGDGGVSDGAGGDAGVAISGRACLLGDLRKLTSCAATRAGGLKVALSIAGASDAGAAIATTTTGDDGRFTITAPLGAGFVWTVTGGVDVIVTSVMPFGTDNTIPVIRSDTYRALLGSNGAPQQDEAHGSVVVRVVRGVAPVAGVAATVSPIGDSPTLYDSGNSPDDWNVTRTQNDGVVWIPALPLPQAAQVTITLSQLSGAITTTSAAVAREAITFVTQSLP